MENKGNYRFVDGVFSVNTHEKGAGVYKGIPMVYSGGYIYQQYISSVTQLFMFMVLQVVVFWLYITYKFCVVIYFNTKIYFIGGWGGLTNIPVNCSVTLIPYNY